MYKCIYKFINYKCTVTVNKYLYCYNLQLEYILYTFTDHRNKINTLKKKNLPTSFTLHFTIPHNPIKHKYGQMKGVFMNLL